MSALIPGDRALIRLTVSLDLTKRCLEASPLKISFVCVDLVNTLGFTKLLGRGGQDFNPHQRRK